MAIRRKTAKLENLAEVTTLVSESGLTSEIFNIADIPSQLPVGKSSILIMGSRLLQENVVLKMELLDSSGNPIYLEPVNDYSESGGVRVSIEIYDTVSPGTATLTILGELNPTEYTGTIPEQFRNKYNVKHTVPLTINLDVPNDRPIRFYKRPKLTISEVVKGQLTVTNATSGSNTQSLGVVAGKAAPGTEGKSFNIDESRFGEVPTYTDKNFGFSPIGNYDRQESTKKQYTFVIDGNTFKPEMVGGTITIASPVGNPGFRVTDTQVSESYSSRITKVVNSSTIEVQKPFGLRDSSTGKHVVSSMEFSAYSIVYPKTSEFEKSVVNFRSFADIQISDARTFSGDVNRIAGYVKNNGPYGNWTKIIDTPVEAPELLVDESSTTGTTRIGRFISDSAFTTYFTATKGRYGKQSSATLGTSSDPEYLSDSLFVSSSGIDMLVNEPRDWITIELKPAYSMSFKANTEYTLKANLVLDHRNENNTIQDAKAVFHLSGSAFGLSTTNGDRGYGRAIGRRVITSASSAVYGTDNPEFETTFTPDSEGTAVLQVRFTAGHWHVSDISIRPNSTTNFSPEFIRLVAPVPPLQRRPDNLDFAFEFYDVNNNKSSTVVTSLPDNPDGVVFNGENLNILGDDNSIGGSLFLGGDATGSGVQMGGVDSRLPETGERGATASGFIRSVQYQGFTSASQAGDNTGFMIYSGSVLPDSGDGYAGVGLELVGESGSFRFGTNPSRFEVVADAFFVGNTSSQFISGSGGIIEISSSAFHLSSSGDVVISGSVTATSGDIGGWQIIDNKLSGSNATLDATGAAIYKSDEGPDTNPNDGYYIDFTPSNSNPFYVRFGPDFAVSSSGKLIASGALIEGVVTASGGLIANWVIGSDTISKSTGGTFTGLSSTGDTRFFAGASSLTNSGSAAFNVKSNGDISGSQVLFTGGKIGGFVLTDSILRNANNTVELSSTLPGLKIKDAGGTSRVEVKSGSLSTIGGGTQYIGNKSFEDDLSGLSAGRNFVNSITSWSFAEGGSVNISLTDRNAYSDDNQAVSGRVTLDVVVPAGSGNYSSNNTYELSQVITASISQGDTLSFSSVARFSSSFGGKGKDRALGPQYFRAEFLSASAWHPFLPANEFTASNGYGEYFLGSGQYASFGASAEIPVSTTHVRLVLTGSINDDSGFSIEKPLFVGDKGTVNADISGKKFTKTVVGSTSPEYPETEITFDNFSLRSNTRKVEMTQEGLLIYNSEDSFLKMTGAGIEFRGGSGLASFGQSINRETFTNDSQIAGTLAAPALQPYTSDPEDIGTSASDGNVAEFAKGNHRHRLTSGTLDTVLASTNFSSSVQGRFINLTAGTGLTGGGSSGNITVNVVGGTGITANANDIAVDSSVIRNTGAQSIGGVKTFTDEIQANGGLDVTGAVTASTNVSASLTGSFGHILINGSPLQAATGTNTGDVTLAGSRNYITLGANQVITVNEVDISDDTNLTGGTGITLTGDTLSTTDSEIVHDNLSGFVANEHVDHSTVSISAGSGLTGGGTILANRTIHVGQGTGITVNSNDISTNDSEIVHDNLSGFVANEHIDHSGVSITAGAGLTGGGDITTTRTLNIGAGTGVTVNANDIAIGQAIGTGDTPLFSGLFINGTSTFNTSGTGQFQIINAGTNAVQLKAAAGDEIYFGSNNTWQLRFDTTGAAVHLNNGVDFVPDTDSTSALGTTSKRWSNIFTDAITVGGNITVGGTVDGRDLATDGSKLDNIAVGADNFSSWTIGGDSGTSTVGSGQTATIAGTAPISTAESGRTVTISIDADGITDTHLQYNTGQHLTTSSTPTFAGLTSTGTISVGGGSIQKQGTHDLSLHSVKHISFDWDANYDSYVYHGISSRDGSGNFTDDLTIASFDDIHIRVDSNNNDSPAFMNMYNNTHNSATYFGNWGYDGTNYILYHSGRVGIGTETPARKLEIKDTSSNVGIRLTTGTTLDAIIDFGDTDDGDIGRIQYDNNTDKMLFRTNASDRLTIDSSGNIEAVTGNVSGSATSTGSFGNVVVTDTDMAGSLRLAGGGGSRILFNNLRSIEASTDGSALHIGEDYTSIRMRADIRPESNNSHDLGTSSFYWKNLYLNGNIIVNGTVDGRDVASDGSKLDGIESGATADQTITAGSGLTGGGTGNVTLNVGAGTGIDVAADAISVDVSDFMTNGSNDRIVTATGTDGMNAEANLTFNGNALSVTSAADPILVLNKTGGNNAAIHFQAAGAAKAFIYSDANGVLKFGNTATNPVLTLNTNGTIAIASTIDGRDLATDGSKLDGIESGATADQTASEIRTLVEAASDSNVFTDADHSKLNAIEASATADQTITAGTGLDGGGTGDVTLSVDVSDFMTNGSNDRVLTATGADAMNAESGLTYNGSTLSITGNMGAQVSTNGGHINRFTNLDNGTSAYTEIIVESGTSGREIRLGASHNYSSTQWNNTWLYAVGRDLALKTDDGFDIDFYTGGTDTSDIKMSILSGGNVGIGNTSPSYKLDVNGTGRFVGNTDFGAGIDVTGNITVTGTVDGRDLATDGSKLDGIEANAKNDQTITAGSGLTGGGTGDVTLNIGAGTGIDVAADSISVDVSDFMTNGSDNRVLTATGADSMNAESGLTYNGSTGAFKITAGSSGALFQEYSSGMSLWLDGSNGDFSGGDYFGIHAYSTTDLAFSYAGTTRMTIKSGGSVGIGETSPDAKLHIKGTGDLLRLESTNDGVGGAQLDFYHQSATTANNDLVGTINFGGDDSAGNATTYSRISGIATNVSNGSETGAIQFWTRTDASTFSEKVRIDNDGNVGIGTTSPSAALHVKGGAYNENLILQGSSGQSGITMMGSDGVVDGYVYANAGYIGFLDDDTHWAIQHQTDTQTSFRINNTEYMRLTTTGLGIGNTSPSYALDVTGGASETVNMGTLRLDNGFTLTEGASNYANLGSWINVQAIGLYSSTVNSAHIYPNGASDYGAWRINGTRNGWNGITFETGGVYNTLMSNTTTMGMYNDTDNEWMLECTRNGAVRLYYNAAEKLITTSTGVSVTGTLNASNVNTGLGATEVYLMDQNVRTSDAVTFATVNTGQGANELYAMNQNVRTSDSVTFAGVSSTDNVQVQSNGFFFSTGKVTIQSGAGNTIALDAGTGADEVTLSTTTLASAVDITLADGEGLSTTSFTSGFAGSGYRIDQGITATGKTSAEFDNLTVRGTMSIYELLVQQVRATNGNLFISSTGKIDSVSESGGTYTLGVDTGEGSGHGFAAGDVIRMQRFNNTGTGASVTISDLTVQAVSSTGSFTAILSGSSTAPAAGFEYVRLGNTTSSSRQGGIYLTADDSNAPFIDVFDEITEHSDFNTAGKTKTRMGKLSGITSPRFGALSGFGFWASGSVYLEGNVNATAGNIGGWAIAGNAITSSAGIISIDANTKRITITDGSNDRIYLGEITGSSSVYGLKIFDGTGTTDSDLLVELGSARNQIVGWDLTPGNIVSDNEAGSVRLSSTAQALTIWTGSVDETQPKLVVGKLPLHDGTVDTPYGFAVFSGSGTVSGSEASASVLITANKARIAGWELTPGKLSSGTVAKIDGNNATIALGTNATTHTSATPQPSLFFVSASSDPIFFVGENFSYVNDTLTAAGWTLDTESLTSPGGNVKLAAVSTTSNYLGIGTTTFEGAGIFIGQTNTSEYKMSMSGSAGGMFWDNTKLSVKGANATTVFETTTTGATIGGWDITGTTITKNSATINSAGTIALGTNTSYDAAETIFMDGPNARMSIGEGFRYESDSLTIDNNASIAGWSISSAAITKGDVSLQANTTKPGLLITDGTDTILSVVSSSTGLTDVNSLTGSAANDADATNANNDFSLGTNNTNISTNSVNGNWFSDTITWDTDSGASQSEWKYSTSDAEINTQVARLAPGVTTQTYGSIGYAGFYKDFVVEQGVVSLSAFVKAIGWKYYGDFANVKSFVNVQVTGSTASGITNGTQTNLFEKIVPNAATKLTNVGFRFKNPNSTYYIRVRFTAVQQIPSSNKAKQMTLGGYVVDGIKIQGLGGSAGTGATKARTKPLVELTQDGLFMFSNKDSFMRLDDDGFAIKGDIDASDVNAAGDVTISGSLNTLNELNISGSVNFSPAVGIALGHEIPEGKIHASESFDQTNGTAFYPDTIAQGNQPSWRKAGSANYQNLAPGLSGDGTDSFYLGSVFKASFNPFLTPGNDAADTGQYGTTAAYGTGHIYDSYGRLTNCALAAEMITGIAEGYASTAYQMSGSVMFGANKSYDGNKNMWGAQIAFGMPPGNSNKGNCRQRGIQVVQMNGGTIIDNITGVSTYWGQIGYEVVRQGTINANVDGATGGYTQGGFSAFRAENNSNGTYGASAGYGIYLKDYAKHYFSGQVGIGDTQPSYELDVTGEIRATGNIIAYSDARHKDNIETVTNAIEIVNDLRGVRFNWTKEYQEEKKSDKYYNGKKIHENVLEKRQVGLIAQEVQEVLPELVSEDGEGFLSVNYANLVAVLVEANKEQQKLIEDLQERVKALENK